MSKFYRIKSTIHLSEQNNEMDRQKDAPKALTAVNKKKILIFGVSGVLACAMAGYFFSRGKGHEGHEKSAHGEHAVNESESEHGEAKHAESEHGEAKHAESEHGEAKHGATHHDSKHVAKAEVPEESHSLLERVELAAISIQQKVDDLRRSEQIADRLKLENANLRLKLEAVQLDCRIEDAAAHTKGVQSKLLSDTQTKLGRTLASISYKPPGHLFPHQLHTLGVSYFTARDDEKAAVIFTFLTNLDDQPQFKYASEMLMTGVAWYRVDNFELADYYFDKVLATPTQVENLKPHAQARLWKGLVAERVGKHQKAQTLLREILDNHPRSIEATWINPSARARARALEESEGAHRGVASKE